MLTIVKGAALAGAALWIGVIAARGRFWDAGADRLRTPADGETLPDVHAIVPARDEADVIARTIGSLLDQRYPGRVAVTLVDDRSGDGTADVARKTIASRGAQDRAMVVTARPRPEGWTGKVWAMAAGVAAARARRAAQGDDAPAYWWFTDADVEHDPATLAGLVATARLGDRALVSEMVALHCVSGWERLLIPAFVYFFRMLYPFAWVNDDRRATAGAAGGSILLAAPMLERIGGLERIRGELIDDCSLAAAVKGAGGGLWLGLSTRSRSIRPYRSLATIWAMVARTAYTQLSYNPFALAGTVAGMLVLYVAPPAAAIAGLIARRGDVALAGGIGWALLAVAYVPTLRLYGLPSRAAVTLPLAGALYTAMTIDSARRHALGRGGRWKGRDFSPTPSP